MELREQIKKWLEETGVDKLHPYDTGEIDWALNIGKSLVNDTVQSVESAMLILANYRLTVAHMMGMCFARVKYFESVGNRTELITQRAKLNIIKPWHDAIESKIAILKKIHDRKVREATNATGGRR